VLQRLRHAVAVHGGARPEALAQGLARLKEGDLRTALPLGTRTGAGDRRAPRPDHARGRGPGTRGGRCRGRATVEFARATHAPFLSSPARFAQLLTEFLRA